MLKVIFHIPAEIPDDDLSQAEENPYDYLLEEVRSWDVTLEVVQDKVWTGTYRSPEPPINVKALKLINRDSNYVLYRTNYNKWVWRDDMLESDMNDPEAGFVWNNKLDSLPDYIFEEVKCDS